MKKNVNPITIIRYAMIAGLLICAILLQLNNTVSSASIETVAEKVTQACSLTSAVQADNRMFKRLYGLNASDYEGVVLYSPTSNMDVQELLIVKLKDLSQSAQVEAAVQARLQSQLDSFEGYGVEQYKLLQDHALQVRGNYIFYLVHPDAKKGEQAFLKSL